MMPEGYRLGAAGFVPVPIMPPLPAAPDHNVIDSFLLADGVVSGLGLHIDRFVRSVSGFVSLGVSAAELASMVRACLPQVGEWFPAWNATRWIEAGRVRCIFGCGRPRRAGQLPGCGCRRGRIRGNAQKSRGGICRR